jgi:hypothetical protein
MSLVLDLGPREKPRSLNDSDMDEPDEETLELGVVVVKVREPQMSQD